MMITEQKIEEIMMLTFDRLGIPRDARTNASEEKQTQVKFIYLLMENIIVAQLIFGSDKTIETIRAVTDALELILQENRK